ncbi:hypothetical protein AGLY_015293 [Aphis glycines]|uniref:ATP-dependent DNA helicase n=1 Tax=Aphis glycines TaxID=307491 RepID=A0A6G0T228_APHGL|nr:hypothetical protein AGLY_015293 [Aphis glycines]
MEINYEMTKLLLVWLKKTNKQRIPINALSLYCLPSRYTLYDLLLVPILSWSSPPIDHTYTRPVHLFITGQAGTGKTFLFKLLKDLVNRCYSKSVVKVGALSGVAARLVRGSTLHSMLKLPVQKDGRIVQMPLLSGQYFQFQHMWLEWKDVDFIFIDEISMVSYEMLCMIESRLRQLKSPKEMFGGINVLLFGDLMQIPPVKGQPVFRQPRHMIPATHLWELFTLIELTQNIRQHGDTTFIDVLNALRIGELTTSHMSVLMSRASIETDGKFSVEKAMRIYPTNKQVEAHNNKVLQYFREKMPLKNSIDTVISDDINNTGGLPRELVIFVGAKVMLRSNIDVQKGLVNGAIGIVTELKMGWWLPQRSDLQAGHTGRNGGFWRGWDPPDQTKINTISSKIQLRDCRAPYAAFNIIMGFNSP